ncbi:MAG: hypothetical protein RLZZ242_397 [Bacteroidota bacterium]|jgi:uncharacterized protein (DUF488 family)
MPENSIYTIGYGLRSTTEFLALLRHFKIAYIADIRSNPYSKWNPDFCREPIASFFKQHAIGYVYVGDMIGGIPKDSSCYTDGKLDPLKARGHEAFTRGIDRLLLAHKKGLSVALMCGEVAPHQCHRSKLIGEALCEQGVSVTHIIDAQQIKSQTQVMLELTKGKNTTDLFGNTTF